MKNKLLEVVIVVIFLSLLTTPNIITTEILEALKVFINTLFPSIFPFFLVSDLLISYNFPITLNKYLKGVTKRIFHVEGASSFVIIMSMLSGFPSGAKYIKTLLDRKLIDIDEANYLITFTHFANPLFVLTVTKGLFKSTRLSYIILICMYLSNLILGFIIRPKQIKNNKKSLVPLKVPNFSTNLTSSIISSSKLLVIILGNTCFFYIVTGLITKLFHHNQLVTILINGFFDITRGITSLTNLSGFITLKAILILTFLAFGGININMQVASIISNSNIKYTNFLIGRLCQCAISIVIFLTISKCIIII